MTDILPFLKSIISVSGISGYETPVAKLIAEKWRPLVDEVTTSRVGDASSNRSLSAIASHAASLSFRAFSMASSMDPTM